MKLGIRFWAIFGSTFSLTLTPALSYAIQPPLITPLTAPPLELAPLELAQADVTVFTEEDATLEQPDLVTDIEQLDAIQLYNAGVDKLTNADFAGAIADFSAALALDPNDADSFYNRGYSYHVLGNFQAAFDDYGSAVDLNPEFADAYGNRCYAAYQLANYEAALDSCKAAIDLKDDNPDFFINRGNAYDDLAVEALEMNDVDRAAEYQKLAIADYDSAIEIRPNHAKAYYNRALAYNRMDNYTAAKADYTASIERNDQFGEAYFNRGISNYELDLITEAIADLEMAADIFGQQNQLDNKNRAIELLDILKAQ